MKKYSKNKIEADNLIKQIRQKIKETTWEKQNLREGFTETFKPLISQFEDPGEVSKKQNIFTQNQKMLQNQLALTKGLEANQKAITDGFSQFERLADMRELPGVEAIEDSEDDKDDEARAPTPPKSSSSDPQAKKAPLAKFSFQDLDKNLMNKESQEILLSNGFNNLPSFFLDKNISEIYSLVNNVNSRIQDFGKELQNTALIVKEGEYYKAIAKSQNPHSRTKNNINNFNTLSIYSTNLSYLLNFKEKSGSGLFNNPQELLQRFDLLNGSLAAGNNGVLPEYIQLAHRLRDLGIMSNRQLNALLRKVI